ncbi:antibiotic biosynthesis monooxygenase family protein [Jannaschia seohaensis]|uniref:Heme-degrading monooxygenase HmoA n=1 Tax=Jannaschia seohaensis TaxID=475081 RepID=A0A2Y9AJK1_9RHOB|nr:antibiotic biosynthesis monooxygenase family protein [Jannaschia seohaensis]PWJ20228.1 heme-degrading monooxygenase HmoA [Jannaschia seohaensis]SSA44226.1 Heme-degrading monooxygenase HmoA [Jannaschia seohaensis]
MHALFFEMQPKPGHLDHYFEHVARLRPVLARHEGLVFLDRYKALDDPDTILSHQLWESEEAIVAWRENTEHRRSQEAGNKVHFRDYRIRVGERVLHGGAQMDARPVPATSATSFVLALHGSRPVQTAGFSAFASFNREGQYVSLATFGAVEDLQRACDAGPCPDGIDEIAAYAIRRDYGQFDRADAPQPRAP